MKTIQMNALKMDFKDFVIWASGYVLMGIGRGDSLRTLMATVIDNTLRNEMFGDTNIHLRLQEVIKGCSGCDHDEAEGDLWNHCDACRFKVTREVVKIVKGE